MLFTVTQGSPDIIWHATARVPLVMMFWGGLMKLSVALARQLRFFFWGGGGLWAGKVFGRKGPGRSLVTGPKVGWDDREKAQQKY